MKALVLAAGFGKRLKPLTDHLPKPLVPVNGVPMILYSLALLKSQGFTDIVINLHYKGDLIQKLLGNGKSCGLKIRYSHEPVILGTGGGIRKALPYFADQENFLVINSDIIVDMDLHALIKQHLQQQHLATLVLRKHADAKQFGELGYVHEQLVSILDVKTPDQSANASPIEFGHFTGVHILQRKPLTKIPSQRESCIVRHYYQPHLKAGAKLGAHEFHGTWNDCGSITSLDEVAGKLKDQSLKLSYAQTLTDILVAFQKFL